MKRFISLLLIVGLLVCLAACGKRDFTGTSTPGDMTVTLTPHPIHSSGELTDVSESYLKRLCTYAWLDTSDMSYIKLEEDGSCFTAEDEELEKRIEGGSGTWAMRKNAEGYLSLRIDRADGTSYVMYDMELYDQSIYAYGEDGTVYLWLMCSPAA